VRQVGTAGRRAKPLSRLPRECAPFLDFVQALRRQTLEGALDDLRHEIASSLAPLGNCRVAQPRPVHLCSVQTCFVQFCTEQNRPS
jgi:hypothetical protein